MAGERTGSLHRLKQLDGGERLWIGIAAGILAFALLPGSIATSARAIVSWDLAIAVHLVLGWVLVIGTNAPATRASTEAQDQSSPLLLAFVVAAGCASTGGIVYLIGTAKAAAGIGRLAHAAIALAAIGLAWAWIHTRFGFHYAHLFCRHGRTADAQGTMQPSLVFPGGHPPDYLDFMYFAFTIGMAAQVSDVGVASRAMRRLALAHAIVSFSYNLAVIALTINLISVLL